MYWYSAGTLVTDGYKTWAWADTEVKQTTTLQPGPVPGGTFLHPASVTVLQCRLLKPYFFFDWFFLYFSFAFFPSHNHWKSLSRKSTENWCPLPGFVYLKYLWTSGSQWEVGIQELISYSADLSVLDSQHPKRYHTWTVGIDNKYVPDLFKRQYVITLCHK